MAHSEFALIKRYFHRESGVSGVLLGVGDDAALLRVELGVDLVVATDTLLSGVHFPEDCAPYDIAWRSLATNLSDLAAMGATPRWFTLALTLPELNDNWLQRFSSGLFELADAYGVALVGGDTTRGPLSITITVHGEVPAGTALRRDGAQPGDELWVTGSPGLAALGLRQWAEGAADGQARTRFCRPEPRLHFGQQLRGWASACIDVSDGLLADAGHIAERSDVAIEVEADALIFGGALGELDREDALTLGLAGGDDYELCFTAPVSAHTSVLGISQTLGVICTCIGRVRAGTGIQCPGAPSGLTGYDHFREG